MRSSKSSSETREQGQTLDESFESRLGTTFEERDLLEMALTHRSFAFERDSLPHNERLEFLGDAVLGLVVTDLIFSWYPDLPEGEMAQLRASTVNMSVLADAARALQLGSAVKIGKGEELSGGRDKSSILADAFEAVLGALYLDAGIEPVRRLVERLLGPQVRAHAEQGVVRDFKTNLQEVAVARGGGLPEYRHRATGPDHDKRFHVEVFLDGAYAGSGSGKSKKEAEQAAAKVALEKINA